MVERYLRKTRFLINFTNWLVLFTSNLPSLTMLKCVGWELCEPPFYINQQKTWCFLVNMHIYLHASCPATCLREHRHISMSMLKTTYCPTLIYVLIHFYHDMTFTQSIFVVICAIGRLLFCVMVPCSPMGDDPERAGHRIKNKHSKDCVTIVIQSISWKQSQRITALLFLQVPTPTWHSTVPTRAPSWSISPQTIRSTSLWRRRSVLTISRIELPN